MTRNRPAARVALAALAALATLVAARTTHAQPTVTIRGSAFDSLAMAPAAHALILVPATGLTAFADDQGRFTLPALPVGTHLVTFSTPALDSLGLGTLGAQVTVRDGNSTATLATPSYKTLHDALCRNGATIGNDSGIVWGVIRDAAADTRLASARTAFSWYDMGVGADGKLAMHETSRDVRTDSTGTYYACGLPTDIDISAEANGSRSASGLVQFSVGPRHITRIDLLVSTDMVMAPTTTARTAEQLAAAMRPTGTASASGTVVDDKGTPQPNVTITVASVDSALHTNAAGQFSYSGLPAGTQLVEARQVGYAPARTLVDLRPGATSAVTLTLARTSDLAPVNVRATRTSNTDRLDYELRRKEGAGYALEQKDFKDRKDLQSVLQGQVPGVAVTRNRGLTVVTMNRVSFGGSGCVPMVWVDGRRSDMLEADALPIDNIRAIEVFNSAGSVPAIYQGYATGQSRACGAILFWTVFARW